MTKKNVTTTISTDLHAYLDEKHWDERKSLSALLASMIEYAAVQTLGYEPPAAESDDAA
nr:MAG TPA: TRANSCRIPTIONAL REPRESSOR COPG REPRESSOR, DNA-BINDING PROTEIN, PROTEIN-DNA.95A [Caudoviricetes sp.]